MTSLPRSYTVWFLHCQDVTLYDFFIARMLHCMTSSLPGCYTVWFPHYQDVTLYHFVITRMLYRVSSLPGCSIVWFLHCQDVTLVDFVTPGCYTVCFPHYQDVTLYLSSSLLCYTVCFPHYQDVILYHFFITRMLYPIIPYLCILPSWNRTHNRQGIHNRMFRVGLCICHPLCQLLYHLHDICKHQDPNTRHLQENRGPYLFIAVQINQVILPI